MGLVIVATRKEKHSESRRRSNRFVALSGLGRIG